MSESRGIIREEWESYQRAVLPKDAGKTQKLETRRAFYAGAAAFYKIVFEIGDANSPEDKGVDVLESLAEELQRFADGIRNGIN
jgi:hypothetical protein